MQIKLIVGDRSPYRALLLVGDEGEEMLDGYIDTGELWVLFDPEPVGVCLVVEKTSHCCELKNIAVSPDMQGKGYGSMLLGKVMEHYGRRYEKMVLGTGEVKSIMNYYRRHGFEVSGRVVGWFTENYGQITDRGVLLEDMIIMEANIGSMAEKIHAPTDLT